MYDLVSCFNSTLFYSGTVFVKRGIIYRVKAYRKEKNEVIMQLDQRVLKYYVFIIFSSIYHTSVN